MANEDFISSTNIDIDEIWANILDEIAKVVSVYSFDVWMRTLEIVDIKENILVLNTPTKSSQNVLLKTYKKQIIAAANSVYRAITDVEINIKKEISTNEPETTEVSNERVYVDENNKGTLKSNENV